MKIMLSEETSAPRIAGAPDALDATTRERRRRFKVALVAMPFYSARTPSIQIGLLKSIVASHGFSAETFHFNVDFAAMLSPPSAEHLPPRSVSSASSATPRPARSL